MVAWAVRRRHEEEKEVDLITVEAIKIDSLNAHTHCPHQALYAAVLGMRNGDPAANARTAQLFALHDGCNNARHLGRRDCAGGSQRFDQLVYYCWLFIRG